MVGTPTLVPEPSTVMRTELRSHLRTGLPFRLVLARLPPIAAAVLLHEPGQIGNAAR